MKGSTTEMTVANRFSHATQSSLKCDVCNFRGNTYNRDSTLHEADMNS
jgi:ubiquitin C-terminal hydrolase